MFLATSQKQETEEHVVSYLLYILKGTLGSFTVFTKSTSISGTNWQSKTRRRTHLTQVPSDQCTRLEFFKHHGICGTGIPSGQRSVSSRVFVNSRILGRVSWRFRGRISLVKFVNIGFRNLNAVNILPSGYWHPV